MQLFNEDGDIAREKYTELFSKLKDGGTLSGEDAAIYLAEEFACETHGNYCARTLHNRSELHKQYSITIHKLK